MQTVIVIIVVLFATAYAAWRIIDAIRHAADPCRGCKLAEKCRKQECKKITDN